MGLRGPQKTPTAIKKARGTHRADRDLPGVEPQSSKRAPTRVPESVKAHPIALACWKSTLPALKRMRVLSGDDVLSLEMLCLEHAMDHDAQAIIAREGLTVIGGHGGMIANPAVAIQRQARAAKLRLCSEFGLTPAARTKVRASAPASGSKSDPQKQADDFLFGKPRLVKSVGA